MRRRLPWIAVAVALTALTGLRSTAARADPPPAGRHDSYSPYEIQTIDRAVAKVGGVVEPSPEGQILEGVDVVSLDVFEDRDPLPRWLTPIANWFHATTRKYVIEREVLLSPGERYDQALVDETARNLRGLTQLSLVLCVPLRGSAPGRVRLLVITKDVWSLRLNSNYTFADGRLQYLLLQPSEENLLGTHQQILGNFVLDPATIAVGGNYVLPRLAGSRIAASASASAIVNRDTGHVEGTTGAFNYGQPLYSTRATWAWGASLSWDYEIVRRFIAGLETDFDPTSGLCLIAAAPPAGQADHRSCQYRRDVVTGAYAVTRSFGTTLKQDVSIGFSANRHVYRPLDLSGLTLAAQQAFMAGYMPLSDAQIGPYFTYHTYSTRYFDVHDLDSLGLVENVQRGHDVTLQITPVTTALNSTRNFVDVYASATYTVPLGDGLVRGVVTSDNELTRTGVPVGSLSAELRVASPRFGHGRLVFDAYVLDRYANYLNAQSTLGGDTRLRGYPSAMFIGKNLVSANLEYRSDPVEIEAVQLGFVLFADSGDAFNAWSAFHPKQSCGFGLRAVFPQLQRSAMRIDVGFPLTEGALPPGENQVDVVVTFGQAF